MPTKESVQRVVCKLTELFKDGASVNEVISLLRCAAKRTDIDPTAENAPFSKGLIFENNPWVRAFDWTLERNAYDDSEFIYERWVRTITEAHETGRDAEWEMREHVGIPEYLLGLSYLMQHRITTARRHFMSAHRSEQLQNEKHGKTFSDVTHATQEVDLCAILRKAISDVAQREKRLKDSIKERHLSSNSSNMLVILKQWNSSTPVFPKSKGVGGGYFLIWNGKGIAIDPGFDFVRSLHSHGFGIGDIDAIIVTHNHIDHTNDVETIYTLLHELNDQLPPEECRTIPFYASEGTRQKFDWLEPRVMKPGDSRHIFPDVLLHPQLTWHKERPLGAKFAGDTDGVGLLFDLFHPNKRQLRVGITGDTAYNLQLPECYRGVDVLVAHVGTLEEDRDVSPDEGVRQHLGISGLLALARRLPVRKTIGVWILVSELGEELQGQEEFLGDHMQRLVNFATAGPQRYIRFTSLGDALRFEPIAIEFGHLYERRIFVAKPRKCRD
jgi:L-ascorbate metabolism protein UlaG (beta-lactamase superfamily)